MRRLLILALLAFEGSGYGRQRSAAPRAVARRPVAGIAAAAALAVAAPAFAAKPAAEADVDAAMLERMQQSRDKWNARATKRGFGFEAGASMPFVKADTVGAPSRDVAPTTAAPPGPGTAAAAVDAPAAE